MPMSGGVSCDPSAPSPRVFIYDLDYELVQQPVTWRNVRRFARWLAGSPYHEKDGNCADYFLLPSAPPGGEPQGGDAAVARLFDDIRRRWPYWNRTVERGIARHFWILPGDHGPADSGYSRPMYPLKYSKQRPHLLSRQGPAFLNGEAVGQYVSRTWGLAWEALNPASPSRLVFFLSYHGLADGVRNTHGSCLTCFQPGLDIRLPQPEEHECGPLCGLRWSQSSQHVPTAVQRALLAARSVRGTGGGRENNVDVGANVVGGRRPNKLFAQKPQKRRLSSKPAPVGDEARSGESFTTYTTRCTRSLDNPRVNAEWIVELDCSPHGLVGFGCPAIVENGTQLMVQGHDDQSRRMQETRAASSAMRMARSALERLHRTHSTVYTRKAGQNFSLQQKPTPREILADDDVTRNCTLYWAGSVRGRSNGERFDAVAKLGNSPGACIWNTLTTTGRALAPSMRASRYCLSPLGQFNGDSDRYLPAVLYGCVPIMTNRLEIMPLSEHPDMRWNETALYVDGKDIGRLMNLLAALPPGTHKRMAALASRAWPRLLHTSIQFAKWRLLSSMIYGPLVGLGARQGDKCLDCRRPQGVMNTKRWSSAVPSKWPLHNSSSKLRPSSLLEAKESSAAPCILASGVASTLQAQLHEVGLYNVTPVEACGRQSYLGESASTDVYHTVMEILALRLKQPPAPLEPWLEEPRCKTSTQNPNMDDSWYIQHDGNRHAGTQALSKRWTDVSRRGAATTGTAVNDVNSMGCAGRGDGINHASHLSPLTDEYFTLRSKWFERQARQLHPLSPLPHIAPAQRHRLELRAITLK